MNCPIFERNTRQPYNDNLCLFRALAVHLHGKEKLEEETSKTFNLFLNNSEEGDVSIFQGVHLNDIPKVEDLLQLNILLYDLHFVDGELIGELCRRINQKYEKSVKLLRYNNHICYVNNINALFKAFRRTTCDTFFSNTRNLERSCVLLGCIAMPGVKFLFFFGSEIFEWFQNNLLQDPSFFVLFCNDGGFNLDLHVVASRESVTMSWPAKTTHKLNLSKLDFLVRVVQNFRKFQVLKCFRLFLHFRILVSEP